MFVCLSRRAEKEGSPTLNLSLLPALQISLHPALFGSCARRAVEVQLTRLTVCKVLVC